MFSKKKVTDIEVGNKTVIVRVDFNVPLSEGRVIDDTRIRAALPTLNYLIDQGARVVILSHLGRPKAEPDPRFSLAPIAPVLAELLGKPVRFVPATIEPEAHQAVNTLMAGQVLLLENVRFYEGEKTNDPTFAAELASLGDVYVNDAFGTAHRAHASTAGIARYLPAVAGLLLAKELETLSRLFKNPTHPFVAILGGSKVSDKLGVITRLIEVVDVLLIGGGMAFTFEVARGNDVGASLLEQDWVKSCHALLTRAEEVGCRLVLPNDYAVADAFAEDAHTEVVAPDAIPTDWRGLDIGPATCAEFAREIAAAKTLFWNGPMGVFEMRAFEAGTREVAQAVAHNKQAVSVIGGGDSVAALKKFGLTDEVSFISTGGGASMKFLEGASLPGLEALDERE